jgi:hypothetical protein
MSKLSEFSQACSISSAIARAVSGSAPIPTTIRFVNWIHSSSSWRKSGCFCSVSSAAARASS